MTWLTDYQTWLEKRTVNGHRLARLSIAAHLQTARSLAAWYQATYHEDLNPVMLTNYDLLAWRAFSIDRQRVAAATWNIRRAGLAVMVEWIGDASLMEGITLSDPKEVSIRWLDDADYGRLVRQLERLPKAAVTTLEYSRALRNRAMTALMLFAGLRVHEVCALTVSDLQLGERSGKVLIRHGKGGKRAEIPLLISVARKWISEWIEYAHLADNALLFDLTTRTAQRAIAEIGAAAGLAGLKCHDLRWTFIKRTRDGKNSKSGQEVPLETVQKLSRHARTETLLRYITPSWAEMEAAVGGM